MSLKDHLISGNFRHSPKLKYLSNDKYLSRSLPWKINRKMHTSVICGTLGGDYLSAQICYPTINLKKS